MSFVSLGGNGLRPTFFEMVAAERLMPSLKSAVIYSLSVYAQRRPGLHRLLDREDELFFLLSVLLDRQALAASGGSFAEGLYGLRRAPVAADGTASGAGSQPLSSSQRQMSLVLLVSPEAVPAVPDRRV
jgi:peroxin-12